MEQPWRVYNAAMTSESNLVIVEDLHVLKSSLSAPVYFFLHTCTKNTQYRIHSFWGRMIRGPLHAPTFRNNALCVKTRTNQRKGDAA